MPLFDILKSNKHAPTGADNQILAASSSKRSLKNYASSVKSSGGSSMRSMAQSMVSFYSAVTGSGPRVPKRRRPDFSKLGEILSSLLLFRSPTMQVCPNGIRRTHPLRRSCLGRRQHRPRLSSLEAPPVLSLWLTKTISLGWDLYYTATSGPSQRCLCIITLPKLLAKYALRSSRRSTLGASTFGSSLPLTAPSTHSSLL
ncbi:hypothetical protein B0H16DRAFT_447991 [Mycena metata]|uniref:Uncharacterized protein n=1 Tax=Mycena metata TaxID=1033252 RepID=A0AAD7HD01_9AGAR|nr:hypothetical protein B0H16DRAFT_447991 [Mycena metata]